MADKTSISVWLFLKDGKNKGKIVLQKRSPHETSFPYICQATWAGKVEPGELIENAIVRECREELGEDFAGKFYFDSLKLVSKQEFARDGKRWESYNYIDNVEEEVLGLAKMHDMAFSDFVFVGKGDEFFSLKSGKRPEKYVVLFDDQFEVLKTIFNKKWK